MSSSAPPLAPAPTPRALAPRPKAGGPVEDFQAASKTLQATRDPAQAQKALAAMHRSALSLSPEARAQAQGALAAAEGRLAALEVLAKAPPAPKATVVRDPDGAAAWSVSAAAGKLKGLAGRLGWGQAPEPSWGGLKGAALAGARAAWQAAEPAGQAALTKLAAQGRPAGFWEGLGALATAPLAPGIERSSLVGQAAVQLLDPATITQGNKAVCAAAAVQMRLALSQPLRYVQLLQGLASPSGVAPLAGGLVLRREVDWAASDGGRALPDRLFQPALMELGNGEADYLNGRDEDRLPGGGTRAPGLDGPGVARLLNQVTGEGPFHAMGPSYHPQLPAAQADAFDALLATPEDYLAFLAQPKASDPAAQQAMVDALGQELLKGRPAIAILVARMGGGHLNHHAVVVQSIDTKEVRYLNPWGQEEALPLAEFRRSLVAATVR